MDMTICLALICDNKKKAIVVADRMLTQEGLSVEFEHTEPKIKELSKNCLAVISGSATIGSEIFEPIIAQYGEGEAKTSEIAEAVGASYARVRLKKIEEQFFRSRGFSVQEFYRNQQGLHEGLISSLDRVTDEFEFSGGFSVLVVGVDDSGAHIYNIENPGSLTPLNSIGWGCIGSGSPHAENTIIANKYAMNTPLKKALYVAYTAKKHAEIAPGVGKTYTDIAYISEDKTYQYLSEENKVHLKRIYEETETPSAEKEKELKQKLEGLSL